MRSRQPRRRKPEGHTRGQKGPSALGTIPGTLAKVQCSVYRKSSRGVSSARESAGIALQRSRVRIPYPPPFAPPLLARHLFTMTGGSGEILDRPSLFVQCSGYLEVSDCAGRSSKVADVATSPLLRDRPDRPPPGPAAPRSAGTGSAEINRAVAMPARPPAIGPGSALTECGAPEHAEVMATPAGPAAHRRWSALPGRCRLAC
jgi:hypothetical protein